VLLYSVLLPFHIFPIHRGRCSGNYAICSKDADAGADADAFKCMHSTKGRGTLCALVTRSTEPFSSCGPLLKVCGSAAVGGWGDEWKVITYEKKQSPKVKRKHRISIVPFSSTSTGTSTSTSTSAGVQSSKLKS
jgi:hypothetical protein